MDLYLEIIKLHRYFESSVHLSYFSCLKCLLWFLNRSLNGVSEALIVFPDKTITAPITEYITNLWPIKHKKSTDRKYFYFCLLTEKNSQWTVCFSPEKHKLLKVIKDEKRGCEIKRYKTAEGNDILITDFTSIKKLTLDFSQPTHNAVFRKIWNEVTKIIKFVINQRHFSKTNKFWLP